MAIPSNILSGYAEVADAKFYYEIAGAGPTVVLLHAGIVDRRMWDGPFEVLAQQYRVLRYDARSFGNTTSLPNVTFTSFGDLAAVLDALQIEQATLIGCSLGGSTAIDFTLRYPDRVTALITVCAGVSGHEMKSATFQQFMAALMMAIQNRSIPDAVEAQLRAWVDGPQRTPDQVNPAVRARVGEIDTQRIQRDAEIGYLEPQPPDFPALDRLGEIKVPTLVIQGELDDIDLLTAADLLAHGIPNAQKMMIPHAAHLPSMEQPDLFNRAVLNFLRDYLRSV